MASHSQNIMVNLALARTIESRVNLTMAALDAAITYSIMFEELDFQRMLDALLIGETYSVMHDLNHIFNRLEWMDGAWIFNDSCWSARFSK